MKAILETLQTLREYALDKKYEISILYHEEDSALMRFANSAISLNTNEHLIRMEITAYEGRKRASYGLITDLSKVDEMKAGIDMAAEMVKHAEPLSYPVTIPVYEASFADESAYDETLAYISNEDKLAFINQAAGDLETEDLKLSGIFSCGANTFAMINTKSPHTLYSKTSDAQTTFVLASESRKWEITAEQSAQKKTDLDSIVLNQELAFLVKQYQTQPSAQIPLGEYDIVFGSAATAEMLSFFNWIAINGGLMKRGFSFMKEEQIGQKVLSDQFTLTDDPTELQTFPFKKDMMGMERKPFPLFENGVFKGFTWSQEDADEFGAQPTGHTIPHKSLVLKGGQQAVNTLEELVSMPREKDILYIPFLHYMNIVNPSKGLVTASSRFGALLLKKDGTVVVPFNVRLTQSLLDVFGDKIEWLSSTSLPYNVSQSYGARNPTAIVVPKFMKVNNLEISHANSSF